MEAEKKVEEMEKVAIMVKEVVTEVEMVMVVRGLVGTKAGQKDEVKEEDRVKATEVVLKVVEKMEVDLELVMEVVCLEVEMAEVIKEENKVMVKGGKVMQVEKMVV
tara:strand:- start:239 stop:556 length:318 start_codon:yes stop_codon:yes gene_type:complete